MVDAERYLGGKGGGKVDSRIMDREADEISEPRDGLGGAENFSVGWGDSVFMERTELLRQNWYRSDQSVTGWLGYKLRSHNAIATECTRRGREGSSYTKLGSKFVFGAHHPAFVHSRVL